MTNDLARWQFATTSIYHFLFVPVTIGLAFLVALLQTVWYRNEQQEYKRLTRFFGTLLLINVAVGVVTGLVQEFEFGMNWSAYSRFVGDVFGAPLAMEGLAAFFLESTFLGLWIFGWGRLPKRVHLACIWLVAAGAMLSALFILAANSWMQHPVGYVMNSHGQPELNNIVALFTNPTFLWGYVHVLLASLVTGALVMLAICAWQIRKGHEVESFAFAARISVIVLLPVIVLQLFVGNKLGEVETKYQPVKIAAAEAQWENCQPCSFSAFQIGGGKNDQTPSQIIPIPHLLSVLATGTFNGAVVGLNQLQKRRRKEVRARQLHPRRLHPILVDACDGLHRDARPVARGVGRLADPPRPTRRVEVVPAPLDLGGRDAVHHEHRGLDADRERTPAVDRAGADEDDRRQLPFGHLDRHLDQPRRVRPDLHRARRRRPAADVALLAQGAPRRGRRRVGRLGRRRDHDPGAVLLTVVSSRSQDSMTLPAAGR